MKYNVAIIKCEYAAAHEPWIEACKKNPYISSYSVIDIGKNNWQQDVISRKYDIYLLRPPGQTESFKRLFDERIYILHKVLKKSIYPSFEEILIYENKRFLRDWMNAQKIPHPETNVFYYYDEANDFLEKTKYPLVAKTNVGASGSGVVFLKNETDAENYLKQVFFTGIKAKTGLKIMKGSLLNKLKKLYKVQGFVKKRLHDYKASARELQKGFVFFQEFIPHDYEWRCVRIGESYFAHKKIAKNNFSSGTLLKGYDPVPESLLNFVKDISEKNKLSSVSIDIFETTEGFLVNEIQCFFGQSDPYQMLVNGKPGRYVFQKNKWKFEEGMFNTNFSYDLRLEHCINQLSLKNH